MNVRECICRYVYAYAYSYVYVYVNVYMYMYVCTSVRMYVMMYYVTCSAVLSSRCLVEHLCRHRICKNSSSSIATGGKLLCKPNLMMTVPPSIRIVTATFDLCYVSHI